MEPALQSYNTGLLSPARIWADASISKMLDCASSQVCTAQSRKHSFALAKKQRCTDGVWDSPGRREVPACRSWSLRTGRTGISGGRPPERFTPCCRRLAPFLSACRPQRRSPPCACPRASSPDPPRSPPPPTWPPFMGGGMRAYPGRDGEISYKALRCRTRLRGVRSQERAKGRPLKRSRT